MDGPKYLENVVDSTLAPTANGVLFVISQGDAITLDPR